MISRVPILAVTGRGAVSARVSGLRNGADDYLVKPFALAELLARIQALLRRHPPVAEGAVQVGDLAIDARTMSATCRGAPVNLSRTEFALLHALVRNPDRIVTRTELEQGVLPYSEGQTLDVHISNLRKKIGDGYIRTVRGVGYMVRHDGGR
jgi:DNA-binding response OmpR family regulator